jgi:hypothetical protein
MFDYNLPGASNLSENIFELTKAFVVVEISVSRRLSKRYISASCLNFFFHNAHILMLKKSQHIKIETVNSFRIHNVASIFYVSFKENIRFVFLYKTVKTN